MADDSTTALGRVGGHRHGAYACAGALSLHGKIERTRDLALMFRSNRAWFAIECALKVTRRHLF